ncbi:hypothetical protein ACFQYP_09805 [Nonomuraea antimicrobica]
MTQAKPITITPPATQNAASFTSETRRPDRISAVTAMPGTNAITPPKSLPIPEPPSTIANAPSTTIALSPTLPGHRCAITVVASSVPVASSANGMLPSP